jgi:hypothetical protein
LFLPLSRRTFRKNQLTGQRRLGRAGAALLLCFSAACVTGGGELGPPAELARQRLRADDCTLGLSVYQQRLQLPPNASVVVSNATSEPLPPQEQERRAGEFALRCQGLIGTARRAIVRCWLDSADATAFVACNDRF